MVLLTAALAPKFAVVGGSLEVRCMESGAWILSWGSEGGARLRVGVAHMRHTTCCPFESSCSHTPDRGSICYCGGFSGACPGWGRWFGLWAGGTRTVLSVAHKRQVQEILPNCLR